jgi:long-chain acyl-CoA synthetase
VLKLTSGSTDVPKAAIAHVQHLVNDGTHIIEAMGIGPDDVNLACIPLSHSYAIGNIVMPLLLQGTAVALRQSFNPSQFASDVESSGATVFPGVPFMFERLRVLGVEQLPSRLRLLVTAGARIDPSTVRWFQERHGRKVHSFYGSSETGGISFDDSEDLGDPLHVGRPMPETRVEIRDADATGTGRIFVTGTAVASGYAHEDPGGLDSGFADGGFMTGDLGYRDPQGRLVLTGRVSLLVNVAGRKVDPAEVERMLVHLPEVIDAHVIGASCDRRGQQLVAFVISKAALTPVAMRQRCAKVLSPHKIPRRFIFLDQFPIDSRGKMDHRALAALASDQEW